MGGTAQAWGWRTPIGPASLPPDGLLTLGLLIASLLHTSTDGELTTFPRQSSPYKHSLTFSSSPFHEGGNHHPELSTLDLRIKFQGNLGVRRTPANLAYMSFPLSPVFFKPVFVPMLRPEQAWQVGRQLTGLSPTKPPGSTTCGTPGVGTLGTSWLACQWAQRQAAEQPGWTGGREA